MLKKKTLSLPFVIIITCLQTAISIVPGALFFRDSSQGPNILPYMIAYLLICDFFHIFGRMTYKQGRSLALPAYSLKIIISVVLIFLITKETAIQFATILLAYEGFQLLTFSKRFFYIDSLSYSVVNAFFKGIVFNQLLTINYPFTYHFDLMKPFIFSFVLILFITILSQGMYSFLKRQAWFLILAVLCLVAIYFLLFRQYQDGSINLLKFIGFTLINLASIYFFLRSKSMHKKEFVLNVMALIGLYIYYL
ncbi:hypothetical protein ACWOAH_09390 [Vagococcus vulneris]|uniref:Uncharacterized protein n=1 Tax=Vagococcus vulneris TaxID=1977869 RepID=A0A429ZUC6_9ENTE|nr:hypothetical protein [Vagococcus vulneris]RST97345.1 hypothetical protein CBF37_09690 [Vagococcus vulneris]